MCGARSSLSFQISYLIESNQVGQEEFEHISKQSAQRVVLQAVSMYDNKVPQSQQVQNQVSNTNITLTKLYNRLWYALTTSFSKQYQTSRI